MKPVIRQLPMEPNVPANSSSSPSPSPLLSITGKVGPEMAI